MRCRCEHDKEEFDGVPTPLPTGEAFIECLFCGRRYFKQDDGAYRSDRQLTILTGRVTWDTLGLTHFGHITKNESEQVYMLVIPGVRPGGPAVLFNRGYARLRSVSRAQGVCLAAEARPVVVEYERTYTMPGVTGAAYWFEEPLPNAKEKDNEIVCHREK